MVKGICMNCYKETEFLINSIDYAGHEVYECTICHEPDYELEEDDY